MDDFLLGLAPKGFYADPGGIHMQTGFPTSR